MAQREADGKAIGAACRHALRGIEDCYNLNEKALKTAVFAGWKDMDQYMRENKIEGQPSRLEQPGEEVLEGKKPASTASEKPKGKPAAAASRSK